ncbi:hypothetical protein E1218_09155 [Kribbella turkmenica]|uniref:Uncharacterized protein n=1 Tax=Kribbella turkmenica TaxID=2530375 RepID=A0A4R4XB99_9ACTN|nr:hypothetical protein [Kribbella turkmenica]TDD27824.1 hypothetical protein E1218_09155 [Kribbella turkmenica]
MSYPPPGPQDQRPQDRTHGYVPGSAAPDYGRPPRKNRAGLIITLLLVLLVAVLGVGGVVAYRLISDKTSSAPDPFRTSAAPASTPDPTVPPSQPPKTSRPSATKRPVTPRPVATPPVTGSRPNATEHARRFVAQLNANNPTAAAALACQSSRQLIRTLMRTHLQPPTSLTTGTPIGQQTTFVIPLSGTTRGATVSGVVIIHDLDAEPLCVRVFNLTPR